MTPLILAVVYWRGARPIRMLLSAKASLGEQDKQGKTALMHAVEKESVHQARLVRMLLEGAVAGELVRIKSESAATVSEDTATECDEEDTEYDEDAISDSDDDSEGSVSPRAKRFKTA